MGHNVLTECAALTKMLQVTMLDARAFDKAVEQGYIEVRADGTLSWTLENDTLLAYFCGRLWSGDRGKYSRRKGSVLWKLGKRSFPGTALEKLFGVSWLRNKRDRRKNLVLPDHFELVDYLFDNAGFVDIV